MLLSRLKSSSDITLHPERKIKLKAWPQCSPLPTSLTPAFLHYILLTIPVPLVSLRFSMNIKLNPFLGLLLTVPSAWDMPQNHSHPASQLKCDLSKDTVPVYPTKLQLLFISLLYVWWKTATDSLKRCISLEVTDMAFYKNQCILFSDLGLAVQGPWVSIWMYSENNSTSVNGGGRSILILGDFLLNTSQYLK